MMDLIVKRLTATAQLPTYGSPGAIGADLYADVGKKTVILAGQRLMVPTGIAVVIPEGCYGRVAPRSGLAKNFGIDILAGVVDPDYRGEVFVGILNTGEKSFAILPGDRIAQLILEQALRVSVTETLSLPETTRGERGFGSSGS